MQFKCLSVLVFLYLFCITVASDSVGAFFFSMKPGVLAIRTSGDIGNAEWRQECLILPVLVRFSFLFVSCSDSVILEED